MVNVNIKIKADVLPGKAFKKITAKEITIHFSGCLLYAQDIFLKSQAWPHCLKTINHKQTQKFKNYL